MEEKYLNAESSLEIEKQTSDRKENEIQMLKDQIDEVKPFFKFFFSSLFSFSIMNKHKNLLERLRIYKKL